MAQRPKYYELNAWLCISALLPLSHGPPCLGYYAVGVHSSVPKSNGSAVTIGLGTCPCAVLSVSRGGEAERALDRKHQSLWPNFLHQFNEFNSTKIRLF